MSADAAPASSSVPSAPPVQDRIKHVFVLMLENRSFDHLFALSGIANITAASPHDSNAYGGAVYPFGGGAPDRMPTDPCHEFDDVLEQLCGAGVPFVKGRRYPRVDNSGFVSNYATSHSEGAPPQPGALGTIMQGADVRMQAPSLYALANAFVLCDRWHASMPGPTWPNRFFLHGASSAGLDHSPTKEEMAGWDAFDGFRYPNGSIFAALGDDNWRIYQDQSGDPLGHVPQVASLKGVSFFDVDDLSHFEADLAAGYTARYTFIEPGYGDIVHGTYRNGSSHHPMDGLAGGDQLVARVYDAIRNSPVWDSSLLVVVYDEHGGFYDSVAPGAAPPPNDGAGATLNASGFEFDVYGVRVPAIVVSPWVAAAHVDHTPYDHSSIVATLGRLFGLAPLTERDRAANDLLSLVTATCRTDCPARIGS